MKQNKTKKKNENQDLWKSDTFSMVKFLLTELDTNTKSLCNHFADTLGEFRSVVKDTKSNTKHFTKSISIHSDYQSVHFW